jgi:subtilisin family serine protease
VPPERALAALLLLAAALAVPTPAGAALGTVDRGLIAALRSHGEVPVIVAFRDGPGPQRALADRERAAAAVRGRVLARLGPGSGFEPGPRWHVVMAMSGRAIPEAVHRLAVDPEVARVGLDPGGSLADAESAALIGAPAAAARGLTGRGVTVAVVDSGVDVSHPDLSASVVAEHCFLPPAGCPNGAGEQDGPGSARDDHGHGTNVAGIVTGDGAVAPAGIAPDAAVVAVRVSDAANRFAAASQVISGLDWIARFHREVRVVNASIGTDELFPGPCDSARAYTLAFASATSSLRAAGAVVFASAGNAASPSAIAAPACIAAVEAVGAVYDSAFGAFSGPDFGLPCSEPMTAPDAVACFSNSSPALDLLAPGALLLSTGRGGGASLFAGTSQAAPHAAAAAAILLQANGTLTPARLEALLHASGRPVTDPRNGLVRPRLDLAAALATPPPAPWVAIAPSRLRFGVVRVGRARTLRLSVGNRGDAPLTARVSTRPPFSVRSEVTVPPGASAPLAVRFGPRQARRYDGVLVIRTNDPARPVVRVPLAGTGSRR